MFKAYVPFILLAAMPAFLFAKLPDPTGETAFYELEKSRSSSMIQSGDVTGTFVGPGASVDGAPSFRLNLDFRMQVIFAGEQAGRQVIDFPEAYFGPDFLNELQRNRTFHSSSFDLEHQGIATIRNRDGRTWANCHKVLMTNVQMVQPESFINLWRVLAWSELQRRGDRQFPTGDGLEDLKILLHLLPQIPAIHAARVDIAAKYNGMDVKAGGDLKRP